MGKDIDGNPITANNNNHSIDGFPKVTNNGMYISRVGDATRNPMHFYHSGLNGDWTMPDNTLWNMTTKTPFDPCPPGWRVPAGGGTAADNSL